MRAEATQRISCHAKTSPLAPDFDCTLCPRLADFRAANRQSFPDFFNAPVPALGPQDAELLICGLAPGLKGANRTGRPFTGDYAGDLLFQTLLDYGFAEGDYAARIDDGLRLKNCRIVNAVRCVPPQNKPIGAEINTCRQFLRPELEGRRLILALGGIAHKSVIAALGVRQADYPFAHQARHEINGLTLLDSYHCSRYNTNTGRLTESMFRAVFEQIRQIIGGSDG